MSETKTHKDLEIWQRGIALVERVYKLTEIFPQEEIYGITSQMSRASISYPSNIAEGAARASIKEFIQFVYIALGSLSGLETQVFVSSRLSYHNDRSVLEEIEHLRKMTLSFIKYLKAKSR